MLDCCRDKSRSSSPMKPPVETPFKEDLVAKNGLAMERSSSSGCMKVTGWSGPLPEVKNGAVKTRNGTLITYDSS